MFHDMFHGDEDDLRGSYDERYEIELQKAQDEYDFFWEDYQ